jgi:hypothetical protein
MAPLTPLISHRHLSAADGDHKMCGKYRPADLIFVLFLIAELPRNVHSAQCSCCPQRAAADRRRCSSLHSSTWSWRRLSSEPTTMSSVVQDVSRPSKVNYQASICLISLNRVYVNLLSSLHIFTFEMSVLLKVSPLTALKSPGFAGLVKV